MIAHDKPDPHAIQFDTDYELPPPGPDGMVELPGPFGHPVAMPAGGDPFMISGVCWGYLCP